MNDCPLSLFVAFSFAFFSLSSVSLCFFARAQVFVQGEPADCVAHGAKDNLIIIELLERNERGEETAATWLFQADFREEWLSWTPAITSWVKSAHIPTAAPCSPAGSQLVPFRTSSPAPPSPSSAPPAMASRSSLAGGAAGSKTSPRNNITNSNSSNKTSPRNPVPPAPSTSSPQLSPRGGRRDASYSFGSQTPIVVVPEDFNARAANTEPALPATRPPPRPGDSPASHGLRAIAVGAGEQCLCGGGRVIGRKRLPLRQLRPPRCHY